jgi:DNA polymerase-3 subunit delta
MTALKAHEVSRYLLRPDLEAGVFLCYGPDTGLVRETGQRLVKHFVADDNEALVTLDGGEVDADPGRLALEAGTSSLFSDRRVVRVRGAGKSAVTALAGLLDDPGGSVVVLEAGNLAPRDPLRALVEAGKHGRALPCYPDTDETLIKLINESFAKAGIRTDPDVAPTLRDILGNDREVTRRELEKLELYAARSKRLSRDDVLTLCADNAALVLDEIVDAMGTGHAARLEAALDRAFAAAISPQQLMSSAMSHFAQLRRWRTGVDAGASPREVMDGARPRPHFSRKSSLEQQVRLWRDEALAAAMDRLQTAVADGRKRYGMNETIVRRVLLAIATMAAEH